MNNQFFYLAFVSLLSSCSGTQPEGSKVAGSQPNIIYILADDLGYGDLSCYGQQTLVTPNIDALAQQGMRFTQHYAGATVCAPSRASLLTGHHTGRTSVRGNSPPGQIIGTEKTMASLLREVGYQTAVIGKWGVGNGLQPNDPGRVGFDRYFGYINMWHAHNFYPEFLYDQGKRFPLAGNQLDRDLDYPEDMKEGTGVAKVKQTYVLDEFEREAIRFIKENKDQPFFLFLSLNMPHANNEAGRFTGNGMEVPMKEVNGIFQEDYGMFADKAWPDPEKGFARMMELIDETVGKINGEVENLGLAKNTVVLFSSDNGPHQEGRHEMEFFNSNGALRGMKRDLYEGGIRVPLIIKWPDQISPNSVSDHPCAAWDLLPTFADIAGSSIPSDIDGISFFPTLIGEGSQPQHNYFYWEFYEQGGRQAIRQQDWKYVKLDVRDPKKEPRAELYHLGKDVEEQNNVIDKHPDMATQMEKYLEEAHRPHPLISLFSSSTPQG